MFLAGIALGFTLGIVAQWLLRFVGDLEIVNLAIIALGPKRRHTGRLRRVDSIERVQLDVGECTSNSTVVPAHGFAKGA